MLNARRQSCPISATDMHNVIRSALTRATVYSLIIFLHIRIATGNIDTFGARDIA